MSVQLGVRPVRRPAPLQRGDRVALISPSSHQGRYPPEYVEDAKKVLTGWGLRVAEEPMAEKYMYLAGTDAERALQFERHYTDPQIKALFCTRGGWGAARMLPLLQPTAIAAAEPKWVVGFSDVTSLFAYLRAQAGVSVLHGPCLAAPSAITSPCRAENLEALHQALFDPAARPLYAGGWLHRPAGSAAMTGRLVGGCLSVVVTALGTPWQVDMRDAILFLEDTGEAPYRIDRMLTHLRTAGMFTHLRGIVFGHLQKCDGDPPGLLQDVLRDLFRDAPFPVATGFPCGHGDVNLPLELGAEYQLAADREAATLQKC
ncbi:MAG TPA: LD-carboxypeptidase [bacterium]